MTLALIACVRTQIPVAPGALYIRPILYGTTPNLGAAMVPSIDAELVILASPVWDYFASGAKALRLLVDEHHARAVPHLGMAKTGGNYVAAVALMRVAKQRFAADQILFCPEGQVQETGAANFLLLREGAVLTRSLDPSFLHGVTRDSLLNLARDMGYVTEERIFNVAEMIDWVRDGEAALSGTAAVLTGVGELIHKGQVHRIGSGTTGEHTSRLCDALKAVQRGEREDARGWLTAVPAL
jgi:branched-chain amino acid aminotransferase